jgi:hypothetical protein
LVVEFLVVEFFATSGLLAAAGALGSAFLNHPPRLDSTETEKTTAAETATAAISIRATDRLDLVIFVFFWEVFRRIKRATRSMGVIRKLLCLSLFREFKNWAEK